MRRPHLAFTALLAFGVSAREAGAEPNAAPADNTVDNIIIVLDASGSMEERMPGNGQPGQPTSKMEAAKRALVTVMRDVPATTYVGMLVFSGVGYTSEWVYPLGPFDFVAFESAITPIQPASSTPLGSSLKKGADMLLERRGSTFGYGTYRLVVVSDGNADDNIIGTDPATGQPVSEATLVARYTPEILGRGITMDVIGIAMSGEHMLTRTASSYRSADDPSSLAKALQNVLAESTPPTDPQLTQDMYDMYKTFDAEVGKGMLGALATPDNRPIDHAEGGAVPQAGAGQPGSAKGPPRPGQPPAGQAVPADPPRSRGNGGSVFILLAVIVGIAVVVRKTLKQKR